MVFDKPELVRLDMIPFVCQSSATKGNPVRKNNEGRYEPCAPEETEWRTLKSFSTDDSGHVRYDGDRGVYGCAIVFTLAASVADTAN